MIINTGCDVLRERIVGDARSFGFFGGVVFLCVLPYDEVASAEDEVWGVMEVSRFGEAPDDIAVLPVSVSVFS